jgi:starch synthase
MKEVLHVSPVMPVDERHIELALDAAGVPGTLVSNWLPKPREQPLLRLMPPKSIFQRREPIGLVQRRLSRHLFPDVARGYRIATGHEQVAAHDSFFRKVDESASRKVTPSHAAVIGREVGCLRTFERAHEHCVTRILHVPIAHHDTMRAIFDRERAIFGDICESTFDPAEFEPQRLADMRREMELADYLWCPSTFVKNSLVAAGLPEDRVIVIPFGGENAWLNLPRPKPDGTFLLVGNVSARKGAHRLLKAWKKLGAHRTHRLLLIGAMQLRPGFLRDYQGLYEHMPRVPRAELANYYVRASALALPSLAEGFALVILEAVSCGTPALVSRNSGASGFLQEDAEARFYDAEDDDSLCEALEWALTHPDELEAMGHAGRRRAAAWSWDHFQNAVIEQLRRLRIS